MRNKIILAALFAVLALLAQGWQNGQNPNISNPNIYSCQSPSCHGAKSPGSELLIGSLTGVNTWTQGTNVVFVRVIAAADTTAGGQGGDSTFVNWNYTANLTTCAGGPLPVTINVHTCIGGAGRRFTSNGLWYAEIASSPALQWMTVAGRPGNGQYLTGYCIFTFTVTGGFSDSIKVNACAVLGRGDNDPQNDSTICKSLKLGYSPPLSSEVIREPTTPPGAISFGTVTRIEGGLYVKHKGLWAVYDIAGRRCAFGMAEEELRLSPGVYLVRIYGEKTVRVIVQ